MPRLYLPGLTAARHNALNHAVAALDSLTIGGHASRHAAGGADAIFPVSRSNISDFFASPFWGSIPDKPTTFPPSHHASTHASGGDDAITIDRSQISNWSHVHDGNDAPRIKGIDPTIMQAGTGVLDSTGTANITFPTPFPAGVTPIVFVSSRDANNQGVVLDVTSVSNTGFTVKGRKVTNMASDSQGAHVHQLDYNYTSTTDAALNIRYYFYASDGASPGAVVDVYSPSPGHLYSNKTGAHTHTTSAPAAAGITFTWLAVNL
jgi:hypothetical protein